MGGWCRTNGYIRRNSLPAGAAAAEEISRAENGFLSVLRLLPLGGGGWQQGEDCGLFGKGVRAYAMREDLKQWVDNN